MASGSVAEMELSSVGTYDGTLLLVSHDRRLLDHVSTDRHLHLEDGQVREG